MRFFSKEICEKLFEMECESKSGYYWNNEKPWPHWIIDPEHRKATAYTICDFLDTEEYAKENCRKVFGEKHVSGTDSHIFPTAIDYHRHAIIDSPDAIEYISDAVRGRE